MRDYEVKSNHMTSFPCRTEIKRNREVIYSSAFLAGDTFSFETNLTLQQQQLVAGIHKYCIRREGGI